MVFSVHLVRNEDSWLLLGYTFGESLVRIDFSNKISIDNYLAFESLRDITCTRIYKPRMEISLGTSSNICPNSSSHLTSMEWVLVYFIQVAVPRDALREPKSNNCSDRRECREPASLFGLLLVCSFHLWLICNGQQLLGWYINFNKHGGGPLWRTDRCLFGFNRKTERG